MLPGEGIEPLPVLVTTDPGAGSPLALGIALHAEARHHRAEPRADQQCVVAA
jgi:hypothetical protein